MNYGYFDDEHREYVIIDPRTPYPWSIFLGNDDFFSLASNTVGGCTFFKDAGRRRITHCCYNNAPLDSGGRRRLESKLRKRTRASEVLS